jgi:prevent-host-death family protein
LPIPGRASALANATLSLASLAILATNALDVFDGRDMQTLSARDAKYNFGRLIDMARAEPVTVEKHGRAVVVVLAVEEYERLAGAAARELEKAEKTKKRDE